MIFWRFWTRWVPRKDLSSIQVIWKFVSYFGVFYLTFFATYVSIFYIHLSILTNAGPHDSVMTSAFQASLKVYNSSVFGTAIPSELLPFRLFREVWHP